MISMPPMRSIFSSKFALSALLALTVASVSCTKPKSRHAKATKTTETTRPREAADPYRPLSTGGAELPADTPSRIVELVQAIVESPAANTRQLIALGKQAEAAMVALAESQNIAEARAAMRYVEAARAKAGGPAAARLASHPVPSVRHQALLALKAIGDPAHVPAIEEVIKTATDGTTRSLAIRALAALASANSAQALLALLADTSERVTSEVAAALAALGDRSEPVLQALRDKAQSPNAAAAVGALTALRLLGPKATMTASVLAKPLAHPDARVVYAATRLIPRIPKVAARAEILNRLLTDERPDVRRVALETLPQSGLGDILARATAMLSDADGAVAGAATAVIGLATGAEDRLALLRPLIAHAATEVRQHAVIGLAAAGDKAIKPLVARMALERDPMVQLFLARTLGRLKASSAVDALIALLSDRAAGAPTKVQAKASLEIITGQRLGLNGRAWRRWRDQKAHTPPSD